jgi:hypothetical protein
MFNNISNYENINDYLPIFTASLIIYILSIITIYYTNKYNITKLNNFYEKFNFSMILTDVLLIVISINKVRYFYSYFFKEYTLINFLITGIIIQIIYDLLLTDLYNLIPINNSLLMNIFKNKKNEIVKLPVMITNIITNSSGILLASYLATFPINNNINLLITALHSISYLIYLIK